MPPLTIDPAIAGQGTSVVIGIDASGLSAGGKRATSTVVSLPRGMRFDIRAAERLCSKSQAAGGGCPKGSKVGFGRSVVSVGGFLSPGGETEVDWSIGAYLGKPARRGDLASLVLRAELLGRDRIDQLLVPYLGHDIPPVSISTARIVPARSSQYGVEVQLGTLPGEVDPPSSMTETPTRFELALSAVRRVRQNFVRHVRIRTLSGYRTRKIPDHRLVGYDLLRTPNSCSGSWRLQLKSSFPSGARRSTQEIICTKGP